MVMKIRRCYFCCLNVKDKDIIHHTERNTNYSFCKECYFIFKFLERYDSTKHIDGLARMRDLLRKRSRHCKNCKNYVKSRPEKCAYGKYTGIRYNQEKYPYSYAVLCGSGNFFKRRIYNM